MMKTATIFQFTNWNILNVPEVEGVYELTDILQRTIYIGRSVNLKQRLLQHLNTDDSCIANAKYFRFEVTNYSESREIELQRQYRMNMGKLPRCNDRIG